MRTKPFIDTLYIFSSDDLTVFNKSPKRSWHYFLHTLAKQSMSPPPVSSICHRPTHGNYLRIKSPSVTGRGWAQLELTHTLYSTTT